MKKRDKFYHPDKEPKGSKRSSLWRGVRTRHLALQPNCALCDGHKHVEVHHIHPFHTHPHLELDPTNLITLCENKKDGINCHLAFGHLGNFKSVNVAVKRDSSTWSKKIKNRP